MSIRPRRLALRAVTVLAAAGAVDLRVPTESDTAGTVALQVTLPPLRSVRTTPMPGWTAVLQRSGETVTGVTWTADPGVRIGPGQFADVALSLGPLPTDTLVLPAVHTYDDGPDRPAPTVELVLESGTDDTARWIGGGGLLVGALGLGPGGGAVLQNRRKESTR